MNDRRLVLPALEEAALQSFNDVPSARAKAQVHHAGLCFAAEHGFYSIDVLNRHGVSDFWYQWCRANRHAPVVRKTDGSDFVTLICHLPAMGEPPPCRLPHDSAPLIERLLRSFADGKGAASAGVLGCSVGMVDLDDSRECASILVDALNEHLIWEVA